MSHMKEGRISHLVQPHMTKTGSSSLLCPFMESSFVDNFACVTLLTNKLHAVHAIRINTVWRLPEQFCLAHCLQAVLENSAALPLGGVMRV